MSDFLEKAICLQLFCAGEKLNVRASKVSLVRYNDSVRNLLGVQTIRMNMWFYWCADEASFMWGKTSYLT